MKPVDIEKMMEKIKVTPSSQMNQRTLSDIFKAQEKTKQRNSADLRPMNWRIIMNKTITKFAFAAVIIIAVIIGMNQFGTSIDGTSVAWGQVTQRIANIDHFHFYEVSNTRNGYPTIQEGWYAYGKLKTLRYDSYGGYQSFDDGQTSTVFDRHNNITCVGKSPIGNFGNIFEAITDGGLSFDLSQFQNKEPSLSGADFLIYEFDPPKELDWIEKFSVTVGRNSLVPIQIKTYFKNEEWCDLSRLLVFDYEEPGKDISFFEISKETKPPHGIGHVVLGGEEVEIPIENAPGIQKAIVRLHTKFDGPVEELLIPYRDRYEFVGGPVYFMEITFIIDEGYRSNTSKNCPLWLNQGTKAALGNKEVWPDKKYRNIRYTPVLRATDKEDEFILELSCWLRTKTGL